MFSQIVAALVLSVASFGASFALVHETPATPAHVQVTYADPLPFDLASELATFPGPRVITARTTVIYSNAAPTVPAAVVPSVERQLVCGSFQALENDAVQTVRYCQFL